MLRTIVGYAVLAILGILALKLLFGLLSIAFTLFWALLWLALLGFIFYLVLKVISPSTAKRVKEKIKGEAE
ncbi:MAG: hypothetical protein OEO20_12670 [Gemmatimonadota bacterium]|jgi:predicted membrane protein|nr:hypothetical protein [Gemmatimonadota bacterium]MDH3479148.1 hypothetical protein [Gemmatimonadota bacterium]MDH3569786.1 hypothetical protein [Gemmatimonadota bacterium]MDH5548879.1 hypothetical protein [Gemmatimonadota bacterium]